MQSNGTLNINGGLVVALGGSDSPAGGLLCGDGYELSFNGGVVVATGGTNSTPSSSSAQHVLVLGSAPQGSALHIARDDAADKEHPVDVLTFNVNKAYQSLVFTSPELLGSRTYTLLKGGSISGGTEFHGLYTGAAYSGGSAWATFTTTSVVTYVNPSAIYLPLVMQAGGSSAASTATPTTQSSTATPTPTPTAQASTATPTPTATATPATPTDTPTPTATPIQSGETVIHLGDPITVDGSGAVVTGSTVTINAGGSYRATGTLADGAIEVNTTGEVTLTLDGANITHSSGPAINVTNAEKLSLVLATGTINTLIDGATYTNTDLKGTLFSNDTLEISGQGALLVTGRYKHGVVSDDDLIINSGNITIVSVVTDGFHANDNITINDGTIQILQTGSDGFESEGTFDVQGGTLTLTVGDDGLIGQNTVTINGGTIQVTSGVEGIESKNNLIVNDGALTIAVSDDGLNAANDITINGGQIYVTATGDAVDSNGTLNINGGTLVMLGGNAPEGGLDCDQCNIVFNGGTVVATGGANSTPSNNSGQYVVVLGNTTVGSVIHIARDDGADIEHPTDVLTFKISKAYQSMIFTSPTLLGSRTYTLYKDGSVSGGTDFHGLYTGATYSGGSTWTTFTTTSKVTNVGGGGPNPPPGP
jgi:hypothetical protein